jgi:hypothetical protein
MESCSHPEIKDSSGCSRCRFQQARYPVNGYAEEYPFPHEKAPGLSCLNRCSWCEWATSFPSRPLASLKTVTVSSNGTPCFLKVAMAFVNDGGRLTRRMVLIAFSGCTSYMIVVASVKRTNE